MSVYYKNTNKLQLILVLLQQQNYKRIFRGFFNSTTRFAFQAIYLNHHIAKMSEPTKQTKNYWPPSVNIISSTLDHIFSLTQKQIKQNVIIAANMNPYTSMKVNHLINQIGELINQEAEQSQSQVLKGIKSLQTIHQNDVFPKDNWFTSGAHIIVNQNISSIASQRDQINSLNSFKTSFCKSRTYSVSLNKQSETIQLFKQIEESHVNPLSRERSKEKKQNPNLINLRPSTKTGRSKTSAFDTSQSKQEKTYQQLIDQFREQKVIEQETNRKNSEKQNKTSTLLNKDQIIVSFNYEGQLVKMNKREFTTMSNKMANQKMIDSNLVPGGNMFWKTKKTEKNLNQKSKTLNSTYTQITSQIKLKNQSLDKKAQSNTKQMSSKAIENLMKNSITIQRKKNITLESQEKPTSHYIQKKHSHHNVNSSSSNRLNQPLIGDEIKSQSNVVNFLNDSLEKYHQNQQNFMPQWIQSMQTGCKVTFFLKERENNNQTQNKFQKHEEKTRNKFQSIKASRSYSQPIENLAKEESRKKQNGSEKIEKLGSAVKCISNLKNHQRKENDLIAEWERRKSLKTIEISKDLNQRRGGKNSIHFTDRKSRSVQKKDSFQFARSITDINPLQRRFLKTEENNKDKNILTNAILKANCQGQQLIDPILNGKAKTSLTPKSHSNKPLVNYAERLKQQDSLSQSSNNVQGMKNNNGQALNLNRQEFKVVKSYLQSRNSVLRKKQTISQYRTQSILDLRNQKTKTQSQANSHLQTNNKQNDLDILNKMTTILQQKSKTDKNGKQIKTFGKYRNNNENERSLSLMEKSSSKSVQRRIKRQGSIHVANQVLKSSLLGSLSALEISRSSILYTKFKTPNDQKTSKDVKWKLNQNSEIHRISQSQKRLLPIYSSSKAQHVDLTDKKKNSQVLNRSDILLSKQISSKKKPSIIIAKPRHVAIKANLLQKTVK